MTKRVHTVTVHAKLSWGVRLILLLARSDRFWVGVLVGSLMTAVIAVAVLAKEHG